ncbi:xanthine dehydrogenase family protein subunit M [Pseudonocardia sp. ICBG1122]|nr:xanthine dehydrogenase family protein subunit M [Pseudonocardia pini]
MKPAPFGHVRARSVEHAVEVLVAEDGDAKILAGGQSLVPLLAMRMAQPTVLVDLGGCTELAYVRDGGDHVEIGAMTRTRDVEVSPLVRAAVPLLPLALSYVGHVTIRNRGTFGGTVAHADPAAEVPAVLRALDATVVVTGPRGTRTVPAAEFFLGFLLSAVEPDEVLTAVRVPRQSLGTAVAVEEFARRHGDFAMASVLGAARVGADGTVADVRLVLGGVGPTPVRADGAERLLVGQAPSEELVRAAADVAVDATDPAGDVHASAEYRRTLARVLTRRCLSTVLADTTRSHAA